MVAQAGAGHQLGQRVALCGKARDLGRDAGEHPTATDGPCETQRVEIDHHGDTITFLATTRPDDGGGPGALAWRGEARLWDNDTVMGWYTATNPTRSAKGVLYLRLDKDHRTLTGRWTGTAHADGPIATGPATLTRDTALVDQAQRDDT